MTVLHKPPVPARLPAPAASRMPSDAAVEGVSGAIGGEIAGAGERQWVAKAFPAAPWLTCAHPGLDAGGCRCHCRLCCHSVRAGIVATVATYPLMTVRMPAREGRQQAATPGQACKAASRARMHHRCCCRCRCSCTPAGQHSASHACQGGAASAGGGGPGAAGPWPPCRRTARDGRGAACWLTV